MLRFIKRMNFLSTVIELLLCATICSCGQCQQHIIVGKWYCVSNHCPIEWIEFKKDGILIDADGKAYDYIVSDDDLIVKTSYTSAALKIIKLTNQELVLKRDNEQMTFQHSKKKLETINNIDSTTGETTLYFGGIVISLYRETMQTILSSLGFAEEGVEFQPRGGGYGSDIYYYSGDYSGFTNLKVGLECDGYDDSILESITIELPDAETAKRMLAMLQEQYGSHQAKKDDQYSEYRWVLPGYTLLFVQSVSNSEKNLLHIVF